MNKKNQKQILEEGIREKSKKINILKVVLRGIQRFQENKMTEIEKMKLKKMEEDLLDF